jgi:type III restriction enzyme
MAMEMTLKSSGRIFILVAEQDDDVVADIIDRHGFHFADDLPKLRGPARYAEPHSQNYRRIEGVAETGGKLRVLDLTRTDVRQAVTGATSAEVLYKGAAAGNYV